MGCATITATIENDGQISAFFEQGAINATFEQGSIEIELVCTPSLGEYTILLSRDYIPLTINDNYIILED